MFASIGFTAAIGPTEIAGLDLNHLRIGMYGPLGGGTNRGVGFQWGLDFNLLRIGLAL